MFAAECPMEARAQSERFFLQNDFKIPNVLIPFAKSLSRFTENVPKIIWQSETRASTLSEVNSVHLRET